MINTLYMYKNNIKILPFVVLFAMLTLSCDSKFFDNGSDDVDAGPITITKVYLQDVNSSVPDREVTFARLGQLIRIEGTGFTGLKKVYINGFSTYFNPVYVSDKSILVTVSKNTPTVDADESVRNTIKLANDEYEAMYTIEIRSAAPEITRISNTLPLTGEKITIFGSGLVEVNRIVFPGNIEVTEGILSDDDGEFCEVTIPEGISEEGGSVLLECANGGVYSPAYFNFKKGVIMNFDGTGVHGFWGSTASMIRPEDLDSVQVGEVNVSQGKYCSHKPARIDTIKATSVRCSEVWTAGNGVDDWRGQLTPYIATSTPLENVAFQFDIFVPEAWQGSGYLKVCLVNGFNGGEWSRESYNFVPWIENGESIPFQTESWTTVTIPLNKIYSLASEGNTFEDALLTRDNASYQNFGFYLENTDFNLANVTGNSGDAEIEFPSSNITSLQVFTDNWRIVSLNTPLYSDFPADDIIH